jgi:hypothetical protein
VFLHTAQQPWSSFPSSQISTSFERILRIKVERGTTYELSNVGLVKIAGNQANAKVKLEKLVFTQCAVVAGHAIDCSVISTLDGPLVLSLTWQQGVVK